MITSTGTPLGGCRLGGEDLIFRFVSGCLILFGISLSVVHAQQANDGERMAIANFIDETIQCTSYYSIIGNMETNSPDWAALAEKHISLAEAMGMTALTLSDSIEMSREAVLAKLQSYTEEMGKATQYDAINLSLLLEQYGEECRFLVENPTARLNYWMDQEKK